jgi:ferritin-like metal-binding protein YciE
MGLFTKEIKNLSDLYLHGLEDLYYAENEILKSLPKMIEQATNPKLKQGLEQHRKETEGQVRRLEEVFAAHDREASGTKCPAIDGIIKEGDDLMGEVDDEEVMSVGIIAAAQAVEHYEITRYGALIAWAKELGHRQDAVVLARNLEEEKAADRKLTMLAESRVNPDAAGDAVPKRAQSRKAVSSRRAAAARRPKATRTKKASAKKAAGRRR